MLEDGVLIGAFLPCEALISTDTKAIAMPPNIPPQKSTLATMSIRFLTLWLYALPLNADGVR